MPKVSTYPVATSADNIDLAGVQGGVTKKLPSSLLATQAELDAVDAAAMKLAGTQTVTGAKTFNAGTLLDKGNEVFNIEAYGAVLATVSTHQPAIQAAVDAANAAGGGIVLIPPGPWEVTGITAKSNVTIKAKGWLPTIKLANAANPVNGIIGNAYTGAAVENFRVEGIRINGNKANNLTEGIGVNVYGNNISVADCYIHDTPKACVVLGVVTADQAGGKGNLRIERNHGHNPGLSGTFWGAFAFTGGDNVVMANNIATTSESGVMAYSYDVEPNPSWTVRRVLIADNIAKGGPIVVAGSGSATVTDVEVAGNLCDVGVAGGTPAGLRVDTVTGRVSVHGNTVIGPNHTSAVLYLRGLTAPHVHGNDLSGMGASQDVYPNNVGIWLENVTGGAVGNNFIHASAATHATAPAGIRESGTTAGVQYGINEFRNITVIGAGGDPNPVGISPIGATLTAAPSSTANQMVAHEVPALARAKTLTKVWFEVTTSAGNLDFGLYDVLTGARLASTGSFACPAVGVRSQALTAAVTLRPGQRVAVAGVADTTTVGLRFHDGTAGPYYGALASLPLLGGSATAAFPLPSTLSLTGTAGRIFPVFFT